MSKPTHCDAAVAPAARPQFVGAALERARSRSGARGRKRRDGPSPARRARGLCAGYFGVFVPPVISIAPNLSPIWISCEHDVWNETVWISVPLAS